MTVFAAANATIVEALASLNIRPKRFDEGTPQRALCPKCKGGREGTEELTLTIDPGSKGAVWICHRGTCGYKDNLIIPRHDGVVAFLNRQTVRPRPAPPQEKPMSPGAEELERFYGWFKKRGISQETVEAFGCYRSTHWFGKKGDHPEGIYPTIVFPYAWDGVVVNRKYRGPDKQLMQEKGAQHTLFNIDSVVNSGHMVVVEGETDCMAVYEAGWKQVVTLKDGAPAELRDEDDPKRQTDHRFEALNTHAEFLQTIERFILAGDMDAPGKVLREELARRFGRQKCWLVDWPSPCKDASEVLLEYGEDTVRECLENAKPYPIEDVQEVSGEALRDYLKKPPPKTLATGISSLDHILKIPGEGRLIVVTGVPNAGKSQFLMDIMIRLMLREDRRFLVFSPEMQPWEEFSVQCAQVLVGKSARRTSGWMPGDPLMSEEDQLYAGDWMHDRLRFLSSDAEDTAPTLEWILDRGTQCALRLGITDLLIDPWNEIEHQRGGMTETDYTGRALQKVKGFSYRHGCNVWVICHPTKLRPPSPGEAIPPPGPYDINGSANWANKADLGITIHTPMEITSAMIWKSRFSRWGRKGESAELQFDRKTGRYSSLPEAQQEHGFDMWSTLS